MSLHAVIFDLDDTLSDHQYSSACGVAALRGRYEKLQEHSLEDLCARHFELLNTWHLRILAGEEVAATARPKRYREFLEGFGEAVDDTDVSEAVTCYQRSYLSNYRAVPGAVAVVKGVLERGLQVAVLTNHHSIEEQQGKLRDCGLESLEDRLLVSADIGHTKPDAAAFEAALRVVGCPAQDTVMVGDSLRSDIEGARAVGMQVVWLNRRAAHVPDWLRSRTLDSFEPVDRALGLITLATPD